MKTVRKKDVSGDCAELRELLGSLAKQTIADYYGVTRATLQGWLDGHTKPPKPALLLARLQYRGDLSEIMGKAWAEVSISQAGLLLPGWKRPFLPGELRATFMNLQRLYLLDHENIRLRAERADAWQRAEAAEDAAAYYRAQLRLESRMGAMLQAIAV